MILWRKNQLRLEGCKWCKLKGQRRSQSLRCCEVPEIAGEAPASPPQLRQTCPHTNSPPCSVLLPKPQANLSHNHHFIIKTFKPTHPCPHILICKHSSSSSPMPPWLKPYQFPQPPFPPGHAVSRLTSLNEFLLPNFPQTPGTYYGLLNPAELINVTLY